MDVDVVVVVREVVDIALVVEDGAAAGVGGGNSRLGVEDDRPPAVVLSAGEVSVSVFRSILYSYLSLLLSDM